MEKLIELLNDTALIDLIFEDEIQVRNKKLLIISKELGFIKWLVDNDKIDFDKALKNDGTFRYTFHKLTRIKIYEKLIMYLSIQDEPIKSLISILK